MSLLVGKERFRASLMGRGRLNYDKEIKISKQQTIRGGGKSN